MTLPMRSRGQRLETGENVTVVIMPASDGFISTHQWCRSLPAYPPSASTSRRSTAYLRVSMLDEGIARTGEPISLYCHALKRCIHCAAERGFANEFKSPESINTGDCFFARCMLPDGEAKNVAMP